MADRLKVLYVEDNYVDFISLDRFVKESGLPYDLEHASNLKSAEGLIQDNDNDYDIILLDYQLPDGYGTNLLKKTAGVPAVIITNSGSEGVAVKAMKSGADNYVVKDDFGGYLKLIPSVIARTLKTRKLEAEKEQGEKAMAESAKMAALGELGAGVAHELNSPLAGVLSLTELMLKRANAEDENRRYLEMIVDAVMRSKKIITGLLSYASPTSLGLEDVSINDIVDSSMTLFITCCRLESIKVVSELSDDIPGVMANRGQLMQVFSNMIKNSIDAMDKRGTLTVSTGVVERRGACYVEVSIRDTGPGVPEDIQGKVFDPFYTTKDKGGGLNIGLGLSICKGLIEAHNGLIELNSNSGKGATFRLLLPCIKRREEG